MHYHCHHRYDCSLNCHFWEFDVVKKFARTPNPNQARLDKDTILIEDENNYLLDIKPVRTLNVESRSELSKERIKK